MMQKKRPVNLNLMTIRFPMPAISSILHRASGFLLFLALPLVLWGFSASFTAEGFLQFQEWQKNFVVRLVEWLLASGLLYHLVAGIRHLIMDLGYFEEKLSGRISAWVVILLSAFLILIVGVCLL